MKEVLTQFAFYNLWANQQLLNLINQLPPEQQYKEVSSSFASLYKTALHLWNAEAIWWQRLKLQERIVQPAETFSGSFQELADHLLEQNRLWQEWVSHAQEHMLLHVFLYSNTKKEQFKQPVYQMLLHVFNHNTYHRGQLVTMMHQLGIEKIPQTDFIIWSRSARITEGQARGSKPRTA
ncbi:MAG TPA: DinB family protein [Flavisolibacter sp.]|nr:DinB family protein [Flavisolibacter sp.]